MSPCSESGSHWPPSRRRAVEFDIHGLIGIRLIDPRPGDIAAVASQIGPLEAPLKRDPDLTLRFVDQLPAGRVCHLGHGAAFMDGAFFVFDEGGRKTALPFDQIGGRCEILCESGVRSVPFLAQILALQALAKGYVAVHASALLHRNVGILIAGWAGSGKTTALLGFAAMGAEFIGDEWILLGPDGDAMYGLPAPLELSSRHLKNLPHLRRAVSRPRAWMLEGLRTLANGSATRSAWPGRIWRRATVALQRHLAPTVSPQTVFGDHVGSLVAKPDRVFLLISHRDTAIVVEPTPPAVMAGRLALLAQHEQGRFDEYYLAFKFAFPNRKNDLVESSLEDRSRFMGGALRGKETYTVWHPHPLGFSELYEKIRPFCEADGKAPFEVTAEVEHSIATAN